MDTNAAHFDAVAKEATEVIVDGDGGRSPEEHRQEVLTDGSFDWRKVHGNAHIFVVIGYCLFYSLYVLFHALQISLNIQNYKMSYYNNDI